MKQNRSLAAIKKYFSQLVWATALMLLYFMDTRGSISLCLFRIFGFDSCPGCGIGHAIHYALRLDFERSFQEHIFGIPAAAGILFLILKPVFPLKKYQ